MVILEIFAFGIVMVAFGRSFIKDAIAELSSESHLIFVVDCDLKN